MGRKRRPIYGIVAADARSPRDGRYIEDLGRYKPIAEPAVVELNAERVHYWLDQGAQPTDTVRNILSREGILLERHLAVKGKTPEEITETLAQWRAEKALNVKVKTTPEARRKAMLKAEKERVAAEEAELAKARAEADAKAEAEAKAKAEAARQKAEAEIEEMRKKAAEAAKKAQEAANQPDDAAETETNETANAEKTATVAETTVTADDAEATSDEPAADESKQEG
jgi:small subunit ribosomal protein S16